MDPVGAPLASDVHTSNHRQSLLGSFLRVRPRGASQSHQLPPNVQLDHDTHNPTSPDGLANNTNSNTNANGTMSPQPPSPGPGQPGQGHRRRPAAGGGIQPSISAAHGLGGPPIPSGVSVHGLSQMLRRRRSANGALNGGASSANPSNNSPSENITPPSGAQPARPSAQGVTSSNTLNARTHRIRLVPHLDSSRSLHFEPISRDVREGDAALRIGRFTDRSGMGVAALNAQNTNKLAFKSKVVSRAHAEVWCESGGKFFIKDTKSSSGTFLNHIRLSAPNTDSRPFPIKDGDVLQLGVDYQGGTEEIYKCVKMRIELGREWQTQANAFNTNALKQLKALSTQPAADKQAGKPYVAKSGISDCCICLFSVTVHQSLFIAPCSHVFHYKCIRPMLLMHHPGFSCPLCRTFANLDEDVEIDTEDVDTDNVEGSGTGSGADQNSPSGTNAPGRDAMDIDAVVNLSAVLNAANEAAQAHAGAGAETEVERDGPPRLRRNGAAGGTLRNSDSQSRSPTGTGRFERVPEDVDEYPLVEDEGDEEEYGDELHPLPALPVPTPSGPLTIPSGSLSPPTSQMQGYAIQRPMTAPVSPLTRRMVADDTSDNEPDEVFIGISGMHVGVGVDGEGDNSASSAEGPLGAIGAGEKRKR